MSRVSNELMAMLEDALSDSPKAALGAVRRLANELDWLEQRAVSLALTNDYSWGKIGRLLDLSRQGARKKFPPVPEVPAPHVILRNAHLETERQAEAALQHFRDAHAARSSSISQQS